MSPCNAIWLPCLDVLLAASWNGLDACSKRYELQVPSLLSAAMVHAVPAEHARPRCALGHNFQRLDASSDPVESVLSRCSLRWRAPRMTSLIPSSVCRGRPSTPGPTPAFKCMHLRPLGIALLHSDVHAIVLQPALARSVNDLAYALLHLQGLALHRRSRKCSQ